MNIVHIEGRSTSFLHRVANGEIPGKSYLNKYGRNPLIAASLASADILTQGGNYVFTTAARKVNVKSSSVEDAAAGTGAQEVHLLGLDSEMKFQTEVVTLTGQVDKLSALEYLRLFRMVLGDSTPPPTGKNINVGLLTAINTDGVPMASISPDTGKTQMAVWTVEAGTRFSLYGYYAGLNRGQSGGATPQILVELRVRMAADLPNSSWQVAHMLGVGRDGSSPFTQPFLGPLTFPEKTDMIMRGANTNVTNSDISAGFFGVVEEL